MSNVWLLEKGEDYEGGSVLGIYSTEELAMEALVEQRNKQLVRERGPSEIDCGGFYSGCDWWCVSARTVIGNQVPPNLKFLEE